jgi:3-oxoacyl-[acyl-carrier-protein] synthase II
METVRRRVVLTGLGVLSCAGGDVAEFRQNIMRGVCCLGRIEDPRAAQLRSRYAGLIHGAGAARLRAEPGLEGFDRFVHLALVAAREALAAADVLPPKLGRRMGLIFATCSGPMLLIEQHYERILRGDGRLSAEQLFARRYYSGAKILAHALGVQGLSTTVVTACSASTAAIALAGDLIGCGMLDAALAGGSDAFATSTLAGFEGLKATCEDKCAPFSKPLGLNLGEAAGFVFLETPEAAAARGALVQAQLLGSGMSNDAYHCSAPEPAGRGLAGAMRRALANAGLAAERVSYINAHGTGTEANDKAEAKAIRKVFGPRAQSVPVSSTKSMTGHCLGAAGAVEAIAGIVCARAGVLPPTANFTGAREGCDLDCVADAGRSWPGPRVFLSNNSAFGGHNASLVMEVAEERRAAPPEPPGAPAPVCVTACGVVSSLGVGAAGLRDALEQNRSGLSPLAIEGLPPMAAGFVQDAEVEKFDRRLDLRGLDRCSRWAAVAARAAIRESGFPEKPQALAELGLFLHLAAGPSWAESEFLTAFLRNHRQVQHIAAFPYVVPGSVAGNVCRALRLAGHNVTLSAGPGAGLLGMAAAVAALRSGQAAAILSGATDELSERILADRHQAGLLCADGAAPPGEGAAIWMLETATHARDRGAPRLAELGGIACSTETSRASRPDDSLDALEQTIREALREAGVAAQEVAAVCADAPAARLQAVAARICPAWMERRVSAARLTGHMEAAQILADLGAALGFSAAAGASSGVVLGVVSSPHGLNCAVVLNKYVDSPALR